MRQLSDVEKLQQEAARLASEVAKLLSSKGLTLAVAESCTGGLISHTLTNIPGSSTFFLAGLCVYSPDAKVSLLGVPKSLIDERGVVSGEAARAMAERVRMACGADVGLSTTGYAGPASGGEALPVGAVFIGLSTQSQTLARRFHYDADRLGVKLSATVDALRLLLRAVDQA